jgi:hypothetical protein
MREGLDEDKDVRTMTIRNAKGIEPGHNDDNEDDAPEIPSESLQQVLKE